MKLIDQLVSYLRASKEEFRKVSWPTRQDTVRYSALVIGVSIVVAVFFATLDMGFTKLVDYTITQRNAARAQSAQPTAAQATIPVTPTTVPAQTTPTLDLKDLQTAPINVNATTIPAPAKK